MQIKSENKITVYIDRDELLEKFGLDPEQFGSWEIKDFRNPFRIEKGSDARTSDIKITDKPKVGLEITLGINDKDVC